MTDPSISAFAQAILAWLVARPRLFTAAPPLDLTRCNGCLRTPTALIVASAPGGAYAFCLGCRGPDREPPITRRRSR